ncbi:hypothetical protein AVEN_5198-1, partial [Araneus ventricosus]
MSGISNVVSAALDIPATRLKFESTLQF